MMKLNPLFYVLVSTGTFIFLLPLIIPIVTGIQNSIDLMFPLYILASIFGAIFVFMGAVWGIDKK